MGERLPHIRFKDSIRGRLIIPVTAVFLLALSFTLFFTIFLVNPEGEVVVSATTQMDGARYTLKIPAGSPIPHVFATSTFAGTPESRESITSLRFVIRQGAVRL